MAITGNDIAQNTAIREEERLLIGLCRLEFSDEMVTGLKEKILKVTDWDYFTMLANWHGVAALVYHNLNRFKLLDFVPGKSADYLHGRLLMSVSRNAFNTEALAKALKILNKAKIKTVLMKGMALEMSVYGNKGLRQMSDVDVLLTKEDCLRARKLLMQHGYAPLPVKSFFHGRIFAESGKHLPSMIKDGFSFELHHELFRKSDGSATQMMYNSAYPVEIDGQITHIASPQTRFLYLVRHLSLHEIKNESQLRLYTDLVVLLDKYFDAIINGELVKKAKESGVFEIMASRLLAIREYWDVRFPDYINRYIDEYGDKNFIDRFLFFLKSPKDNPVPDNAALYRHQLGEIPGLHRKILFVLGDLLPSLQFMKKRYNCRSNFKAIFYYPHRLGKLLYLIK